MDMRQRATVERAIGQEISRRREAAQKSQSDVAMYARQLGLPWTRATIAAIELGRKQLSLVELAYIPLVLKVADIATGRLTLRDLIPEDAQRVEGPGGQLPLCDVSALLFGEGDDDAIRGRLPKPSIQTMQALDTAEQKAAIALRVPPRAIVDAAYKRWGHSLTMERRERLMKHGTETFTASPRRLQAILGHITRELLDELRPLLKGKKSKTRRSR